MQDPHVHHHLPQFYQRGFIADNTNKIWVYEKGFPPRHRSIRSTGMQIDLYAIQDSRGNMDFATVEKKLSLLENEAARVIQRIKKREQVTQNDRRVLCRFVSVMWRRTPKHERQVKEIAKKLMPKVFEPVDQLDLTPEARLELEHIRQQYSQNPPSFLFPQHVLLRSEFEEVMYQMDWVFFESQTSEFLTSDDPVMFSKGSGLGSPDSVIGFPLTKSLFLQCMRKSSYGNAYDALPDQHVQYFNECTIKNAHKTVYVSHKSDDIQLMVDRYLGAWE